MRRAPHHRPERLAALIKETLAVAIATEVKDPRVGFVTVTGVTVSSDGTHAQVRVSVMGAETERASALEGLESARGFLRSRLARQLTLRTTPELHFHLDRGADHAARIDAIFDEIRNDDS